MDVMNYSDARAQFKSVMDRAIHDKQEVVVTRKKGEAVVVLSLEAWEDYQHWVETNSKLKNRINELIKQCKRTPFAGSGKPEPLRGDLSGWWSRRITKEDPMVYRVTGSGNEQSLEIAQIRFHY
ncbi:Txe/YoeB family addiction module toxin [uncultured Nisaea sp.]|uniref:Txe/YoeB family addiction module toxin n=1 Tax=uncultured Nisaea sp. TaxID=538215 RepID=UPI0030EE461C|tara:strand:+ start:829 stop:1200 length:372 start_codon:yes stop_codon:yes gene_type:complete